MCTVGAVAMASEKGKAVARKKANVGGRTGKAVEASTRTAVARARLPVVMAAELKPLAEVLPWQVLEVY